MAPIAGIEIVGLIAGALTTASFVPQVVRTCRTRQTEDISLWMFLGFCAGVGLWIIYGIVKVVWSIIIANVAVLILASIILYFKLIETFKNLKTKKHAPRSEVAMQSVLLNDVDCESSEHQV